MICTGIASARILGFVDSAIAVLSFSGGLFGGISWIYLRVTGAPGQDFYLAFFAIGMMLAVMGAWARSGLKEQVRSQSQLQFDLESYFSNHARLESWINGNQGSPRRGSNLPDNSHALANAILGKHIRGLVRYIAVHLKTNPKTLQSWIQAADRNAALVAWTENIDRIRSEIGALGGSETFVRELKELAQQFTVSGVKITRSANADHSNQAFDLGGGRFLDAKICQPCLVALMTSVEELIGRHKIVTSITS